MKNTLLFIVFLAVSVAASSQDRIPADLKSVQMRINLLTPSLQLEKSLSNTSSFVLEGGVIAASAFDEWVLVPYVQGAFRNYYPRKNVKKELGYNSGNYVALNVGYYFDDVFNTGSADVDVINAVYFGPVWGLQRNYKSNLHLGFEAGFGLIAGNDELNSLLQLRFTFGFVAF